MHFSCGRKGFRKFLNIFVRFCFDFDKKGSSSVLTEESCGGWKANA